MNTETKRKGKVFHRYIFLSSPSDPFDSPSKNENNQSPFVCGCCVHRKIVFNDDDDDDGPIDLYSSFFLSFFDIHLILKSLTFF
jgi:hypothetical protein